MNNNLFYTNNEISIDDGIKDIDISQIFFFDEYLTKFFSKKVFILFFFNTLSHFLYMEHFFLRKAL